ncbi:hypothetical protein ACFTXJ_33660 [Streptomyces zhihengii]|uniref:hypothetical protein n=1 Tax=Streptomyces zhihengii TaxID=1818004 RepID=UPI0036336EF5
MLITAHPRDSVRLPGGAALVDGSAFETRRGGPSRALLRHGDELFVHDLREVFAGESAPAAVFPFPWPGWHGGVHSVSPDGTFAVFSGQRAVRAVARDGRTLWEHPHACWGPELGHPHTGDAQQVCRGSEHGSCRVSDDGRFVWAHVVAEPEGDADPEYWVVLDARDGRETGRLPLDSCASGSHHLSHPDGVHMGLCVGMGQDGVLTRWARLDGPRPVFREAGGGEDRILVDVHRDHPGFLTVEHYGEDLVLHAPDGTVLAEGAPLPPEDPDDDPAFWDYGCGFVDADTVIASTTDSDEDPAGRHWLLDARTLRVRGMVAYPPGRGGGHVRPLGDGTWLTFDPARETLDRWAPAAG